MRDNLLFFGIPESSATSDDIFTSTGDHIVQGDATSGTAETTSVTTGATGNAPTLQQRHDTTENCEQNVHTFLTN